MHCFTSIYRVNFHDYTQRNESLLLFTNDQPFPLIFESRGNPTASIRIFDLPVKQNVTDLRMTCCHSYKHVAAFGDDHNEMNMRVLLQMDTELLLIKHMYS